MPTLGELAEAVLRDIAPDELDDFDLVVKGFDASPRAHERAQRGVDEETAAGLAEVGEVLGGIVLAVGTDLIKEATENGLKTSGRRALDMLRRRRSTSDTELPVLTDEKANGLRLRARDLALEFGASPDVAASIADAMSTRWPRQKQ